MIITFNPNAKKNLSLKIKTILAAIVITSSFCSVAEIISSKQVIKDITYLASDELKGRASFSHEIDQAANYIAKRFKDIGLKPLKNKSFLQPFTVYNIQPQTLTVVLNNKNISRENVAIATTIEKINWQNNIAHVQIVGKDDDLRKTLRELNQQGGQHLVVIHNTHAKIFKAYQNYFTRGLTKLSLEHPGALVLVLSDDDQIENYAINANVKITQQSLTNVVGILPGTQSAKEIVLYSSHYDHLGVTEDGKQIYNGADEY